MRRWDRLQDSYMEEYRARGLSAYCPKTRSKTQDSPPADAE